MSSVEEKTALLGSIVHSLSLGEVEVIEKGAIVFSKDGVILRVYDLNNTNERNDFDRLELSAMHDCSGKIIMPGFVDCHTHAPQYEFTGTGIDVPLMEWLKIFTFPCESKFSDVEHARRVYTKTVRRNLSCGTTFASYFATIHRDASVVLADVIEEVGQRAFVGKVSMDRHCPDFYIEDTASAIQEVEEFSRQILLRSEVGAELVRQVDEEREKGEYDPTTSFESRNSLLNKTTCPLVVPCVTPRFVPTCTAECMAGIGSISHRYGLPVQSHLSEDADEIDFVKSLHEDVDNYASVYDQCNLLHSGSVMAHCVHCTDEELALLKTTGTSAIHCPSSNFLLGSGIMDVRRTLDLGISVGLGTDVAGGPSPSMLDCMRNVITASRCMGFFFRQRFKYDHHGHHKDVSPDPNTLYQWLNTKEVFHLATQGGADAMGMGNVVGNFLPGKKLDCMVVDIYAAGGVTDVFTDGDVDPILKWEKFIYIGDDRNITAVIVDGKLVLGRV